MNEVIGIFCCKVVDLISKVQAFEAHFINKAHNFRSDGAEIAHKLFCGHFGDILHFFCLVHDVNGLIVFREYFITIS